MKRDTSMDQHRADTAKLEEALRAGGLKLTRQRVALLKTIVGSDDHPDALELRRRSRLLEPTVSLSTIYRALAALQEQGVVLRHVFQGMPARFELADNPHHDHLIDVDTGEIIEFRSEKIEQLQAEIAAERGIELVWHRLELYGRKQVTDK